MSSLYRHKHKAKNQDVSKTPEGILVYLKNKLLIATKVTKEQLDENGKPKTPLVQENTGSLKQLIDSYVSKYMQGDTSSKAHFAKVNIYNEMTKNKMTMKVFFKFLRILCVKKVVFTVTITTVADKEYTVSEDYSLSSGIFVEDQEDE